VRETQFAYHTELCWGKPIEGGQMEDLGADGRIIPYYFEFKKHPVFKCGFYKKIRKLRVPRI
jgi:hypothetical protein